jgi:O-antigen ligase
MLALALAFSGKGRARWFWYLLSAWAVLALFLCGRRKMVYMVPIFLMVVVWIYFYVGRAAKIIPLLGFLAIPAASVYWMADFLGDDAANIIYYTSASEGDSAWDRFQVHGFGSLIGTYQQAGVFGMGLGFATPGAHHLRGARPYVWQESGTSRVLVELGVPGFIGFLAVLAAIVAALWRVTRAHLVARTSTGALSAGLLAFFVANLGSLTVSGQILADSFIVVFMGVLVGIVLGFARAEFMPAQVLASQGPRG